MYQERAAVAVPGAVLWTRRTGPVAERFRVLPDGCMDLIWMDGALVVAGPDTVAQVGESRAGDSITGLRFAPGTAASVLGVPAWELRDLRVALDGLWPDRMVRELTERVGAAADPGAELEAVAAARRSGVEPDPDRDRVRSGVLDGLRRGVRVALLADELGLSERQLRRRCLEVFGYGPKVLDRVLRLDRALAAARGGAPFALVAADVGYADQPHLAREVRALAGVPLRELLGRPAADG
ncbi:MULTISPECIES: helix-turn-helix domain-containing protein [Streptacidiphilus]|uniref:Helix-turn-helix domain-containing protein n=1 Tax=Streptacidiphilus cavernicola TaxID=3342716 RepID=A0ABV6UNT1_9ACTN|nr:helix-turn-helix domain-containing protein [Streptacidiphilus jeojiense]